MTCRCVDGMKRGSSSGVGSLAAAAAAAAVVGTPVSAVMLYDVQVGQCRD
jgi:hypothetical protein